MTAQKGKIWNGEKKEWYRPTYPGNKPDKNSKISRTIITEEVLISQAGVMYLRKNDGTTPHDELVQLSEEVWIYCRYTWLKDRSEIKTYEYDVVEIPEEGKGMVVQYHGCWMAKMEGRSLMLPLYMKEFDNLGSWIENKELFKDPEIDERS